MEWIKRIAVFLGFFWLSGCTLLGTYMDPKNPAPEYTVNGQHVFVHYVALTPTWVVDHNTVHLYHIGPYDVLNIIVWGHPELTTPTTQLATPGDSGFLVSERGNINYPFAGDAHIAGLTISQAQKFLEQKISKYIRNPQITIRVAKFRSQEVQIMGEVGGFRTIPLRDKPLTLLDAINLVGGTNTTTSNTTRIFVIRGNLLNLTVFGLDAKSPQAMMAAQRFVLKNNDIIYVPPLGITSWNRVMGQIFPTLGSVAMTKASVGSFDGNESV